MRDVGLQLAETTRAAAREAGALVLDLERLSAPHHACAARPWVNGWKQAAGTQFHPTMDGAKATAEEIARILGSSTDADPVAFEKDVK